MLLTCGDEHDSIARTGGRRGRVLSAWWPYRGRSAAKPPCCIPGTRAVAVPAQPGRADIDPLLTGSLRRLVVAGTDADLAAVLVRLLRRDGLDVELSYIPADRRSAAARIWGLPHGAAAVELAREGAARPAPLVRDDGGGVLGGRGEVRGPAGPMHGEVYCDGALALRGATRRLVVTPWPDAEPTPGGDARPPPPGAACPREPVGCSSRRPPRPGAAVRRRGPGKRRRPGRTGGLSARHGDPRRRAAPAADHPLGLVPAHGGLAARPQLTPRLPSFDGPWFPVSDNTSETAGVVGVTSTRP